MFEKFSDYMYSLLFTPLKKVKQSVNQFYIFFKVIGLLFDDCKRDIFRVREEAQVISASEVILPEHGRDRNMPRLQSETVEAYRTRLCMKALIAEKAGTLESLELCLKSLGFKGEIVPYFLIDRARWAEFQVKIYYSLDDTRLINMETIRGQIRGVKPASARDNYLFVFSTEYKVKIDYNNQIHFSMSFYPRYNLAFLHLDGMWALDGNRYINGYDSDNLLEFYPVTARFLLAAQEEVQEEARVMVMNQLDHKWKLDSSRKLNGGLSIL